MQSGGRLTDFRTLVREVSDSWSWLKNSPREVLWMILLFLLWREWIHKCPNSLCILHLQCCVEYDFSVEIVERNNSYSSNGDVNFPFLTLQMTDLRTLESKVLKIEYSVVMTRELSYAICWRKRLILRWRKNVLLKVFSIVKCYVWLKPYVTLKLKVSRVRKREECWRMREKCRGE